MGDCACSVIKARRAQEEDILGDDDVAPPFPIPASQSSDDGRVRLVTACETSVGLWDLPLQSALAFARIRNGERFIGSWVP